MVIKSILSKAAFVGQCNALFQQSLLNRVSFLKWFVSETSIKLDAYFFVALYCKKGLSHFPVKS